jgi:hypothetical protein
MLDTIVLDDAKLKDVALGDTMARGKILIEPVLLITDRSHDIIHASEISIVDSRRAYGRILRELEPKPPQRDHHRSVGTAFCFIDPKSNRLILYSYRRESTGLASDALIV